MGVPVVLKSGKNYISLVLDKDMEYVALVQEIVNKFHASEKFFGTEPIALCFEGRKLEEREKLQIMDVIEEYTSVKISMIIDNNKLMEYATNDLLIKKLYPEEYEPKAFYPECYIIERDVEAGETIAVDKTVVVLGNVKRGAIITSDGSIVIRGALLGTAIAGASGDENATISAHAFCAENFRICTELGELDRKDAKISQKFERSKYKAIPKIARLVKGEIVVEPLVEHFNV